MTTTPSIISDIADQDHITAVAVPERERMDFLPSLFATQCVAVEHAIYRMMDRLSVDYKGGDWEFYRLSNGGFYMAPRVDAPFRIFVEGNGFDDEMGADAAGIVATLMTLSHLSFDPRAHDNIAECFHALRSFMDGHPEASSIYSAID